MRWIIVLGMHRSGTSAFTNAVGALGASMGDPSGIRKHFEQTPLRRVNEKLLRSAGGAWDTPPPGGWLDGEVDPELVELGRRVAREQFPDGDAAVWKDPRTCLTLPFWLQVLPKDPVFLVIHRHPTEVAASLTSRNGMGQGHGYALWERYNADALTVIGGRPTVVLDYASVLSDPIGQLQLVHSALGSFGIELRFDPASADHGLTPQQRHHVATDGDSLDQIATEPQRSLFATLQKLEGTHQALSLPAPISEPHPLSTEILGMATQVRELKQARKRSRAAARASTVEKGAAKSSTRARRAAHRRIQQEGAETEKLTPDGPIGPGAATA